MGQNLDVLLFEEGHRDLGFVGFAQLWDPFFQVELMTSHFLITPNNHTPNEVNTILCMVIG